jgi:uncharacterized membrane protein (UPF0136 family)
MTVNATAGLWLLTLVSGMLSVVFTIRLIKTRNFMPAGMLLSVSVLILFMVLYQLTG